LQTVKHGYEECIPPPVREAHEALATGRDLQSVAKLRTSLAEARVFAAALSRGAGKCLIIPSCYSAPLVSLEQARITAELEYRRECSLRPTSLGQLRPHPIGDFLAWVFFAEDPALGPDQDGGGFFVEVDKSDGHLLRDDERDAWVRLQLP
jgi:hypothetical protein